ncbi:MAG: hypothetical protein MH186_00445 [Marinobacter sp.]|nr:hypothetical protein [Marinobacter sp.]
MKRPPPSEDLLTDDQLDYFRANGNNALIFMHGYNVPHGEWGRFLKYDGSREAYHGNAPSFAKANTWHPNRATVWQDTAALSANSSVSLEDEKLNGGGAHNWAVHMEYQLNRAAGFDGEDWMPYSRIINISWPGGYRFHRFHAGGAERHGIRAAPGSAIVAVGKCRHCHQPALSLSWCTGSAHRPEHYGHHRKTRSG